LTFSSRVLCLRTHVSPSRENKQACFPLDFRNGSIVKTCFARTAAAARFNLRLILGSAFLQTFSFLLYVSCVQYVKFLAHCVVLSGE